MLLSVFKLKTIQFWAMTSISKTHGINKRLLENNETSKTFYCLLYTSDAADDMQCVDLGGRRIIKKEERSVGPRARQAPHGYRR